MGGGQGGDGRDDKDKKVRLISFDFIWLLDQR
jgi:hypothetical protein